MTTTPAIILVRPQLPENIGAAARAMANFALDDLRIVRPRVALPDGAATAAAVGAAPLLERARVFDTLEEAVADLTLLYATTARERGQVKPVETPAEAVPYLRMAGGKTGVLFGPERTGLENDEIAVADRVLTFPVNPAFSSLNLAQAVLLFGSAWFQSEGLPFDMPPRSPLAEKQHFQAFFAHLEGALDEAGFFNPPGKKPVMSRNLRNIFSRLGLSQQDLATLHGVVDVLAEGRAKGVRKGRRVLGEVEE